MRLLRAARHAWAEWRFRERWIARHADDLPVQFLLGDPMGEAWYAADTPLGPEGAALRALVRAGDVVLEAGAHHGLYTLCFAHWVGARGHVIAIEANPRNATILRRNVARNGFADRVTVVGAAVGAARGEVWFSRRSNGAILPAPSWRGRRVPVVPLDDFADRHPTVVKLDVESWELEALEGAPRILATRPRLAIELHVPEIAARGRSADELRPFLPADRYAVALQHGADAPPVPWTGASLAALRGDQIHLYATPRGLQ